MVAHVSYEKKIRRRSELSKFLGNEWDQKILDGLLEKERKQQMAQMACRAIVYHVAREVQHAAWVRYGASVNI